MPNYALVLHGGCGSYDLSNQIEAKNYADKKEAMAGIIERGWRLLAEGGKAVDVVEAVVNELETAPCFNAGIGAALGTEKQIELDASIMDGSNRMCGAVACLAGIPLAISVARKVMDECPHRFLVGTGADDFAAQHGFTRIPDEEFITEYQEYWWKQAKEKAASNKLHSTVGAVAIDLSGNSAAATSTGGLTWKMPGRVGDTPIIGAGTYADSRYGAASSTGIGEQIIRAMVTRTAVEHLTNGDTSSEDAARAAITELASFEGGSGGVIVVDTTGTVSACTNETHMPHAYMTSSMDRPHVAMECDETNTLPKHEAAFKLT